MKRKFFYLSIILITATLIGCCNSKEKVYTVEKFCGMPNIENGYEQGVSACYATANEKFIFIAGGCNFPDIPAAEGGKKRYYRGIYRITTEKPGVWEKVGELPEASAYGANMYDDKYWYIVGGINENGASNKAYRIEINTCKIEKLPELPYTIDNLTGTIIDNTLYVIGGNINGKASNKVFVLDLERKNNWMEIPAMPGKPRVQPVCATTNGYIYVWGGFLPANENNEAFVHCDGIRYDISTSTWENIGKIKGKQEIKTLSGGVAIAIDNSCIIAEGGVDKDIFLDAISGKYDLVKKEDYMYKPAYWYRFNNELLLFDTKHNSWVTVGCDSSYARAGAQLVKQGKNLYIIGGELKPGIRTPEISRIKL